MESLPPSHTIRTERKLRQIARKNALPIFIVVILLQIPLHFWQSISAQSNKITPKAKSGAALLNNLGVAYMNRQQLKQALEEFQKAHAMDPNLHAARLNEAIALLNLQQFPQARSILGELSREEPKNPRVWYNLGLYEKSMGHPSESAKYFERVASLDSADADCRYFLGQDYMAMQNYPKAIESFVSALRLNRFHVSAQFALAQAYQRSGNTDKAREYLARFQEEIQNKVGTPMSLTYGDQGKYSLAEEVSPGLEKAPPLITVHFADVTDASGLPTQAAPRAKSGGEEISGAPIGSGACVLDFDGDGRPDILLASADGGGRPGLYRNLGHGRFEDVTKSSGIEIPAAGTGCTIGDYDNDGRPDIAISSAGGISLFHNEGNGKFRDVTASAGIREIGRASCREGV